MNARRLFLKYRTTKRAAGCCKAAFLRLFCGMREGAGSLLYPGLALFNKLLCHPGAAASGADSKGLGLYSQAIDLGNMVFVSGQIPVDPATGKMADTVEEQAAQSLANLKAILAEAGLSMANVVKTVIFLADINDFAAVNAAYAKAFAEPFPARSCVQVAAIPKGAKLEIECIAVRE